MSAAGVVGGIVSLIGAGVSFGAQQDMIRKQTNISMRAENVRAQQMMLETQRRKRQAIRQGLIQRSLAVSNSVNQGAGQGSGARAGAGAGTANAAEGVQTANTGAILGLRNFTNNREYFKATQDGQFWMGIGQGIGAIGNTIMGNAGTISALGQQPLGGNETQAAPSAPQYGSAWRGGWGSTATGW